MSCKRPQAAAAFSPSSLFDSKIENKKPKIADTQTMAATTPISLDETMVYHDLREWIAKQQAKRKPLNEIQLRAINDLLHSDEPEGDLDWNSVLNQYCQVHFAQGASVNYKDTGEPLKWLCTVIFKFASHSDPLPFPSLEAGFIADPATGAKAAPFWTRKKDAKKYAAKCCVEWLIAGGHVARDGGIPKAKARSVAPAVAIFNVKQENGSTTTAGSPQPQASTNPLTPITYQPPTTLNEDTTPQTILVQNICKRLGIVNPIYRLSNANPTDFDSAFYNGFADFGADAIKVPDGLGSVSNIHGKKNARERIAEEVLAWLMEEERRRGEEKKWGWR